jgi:signal transduction histidine kinase
MNAPTRSASTACAGAPRRSRARRTAAGREDELRAFLAMTSHDLKSPLATVSCHLQMLREEGLGGEVERDLDAMDRAIRRMNRMVENLLTQARTDQSDLRVAAVSLDDVIADVTAERVTTDNGARVTTSGSLPAVQADPELLRHVVDNLIGNALKYTRAGVAAQVEVSAQVVPGNAVRVEVADQGIGIPEADRPKVFDAFHRSTNSGGYAGTGLGLAICRRIVERHGGRIGVEQNPGGGSRFWFTLPLGRP